MGLYQSEEIARRAYPNGSSAELYSKFDSCVKPGLKLVLQAQLEAALLMDQVIANLQLSRRLPVKEYHLVFAREISDEELRIAIGDVPGIEGFSRQQLIDFNLNNTGIEHAP